MSEVQFLIGKSLEERLQYYLQHQGDKEIFHSVFADTEWNVLCALQQYEFIQEQLQKILNSAPEGLTTGENMLLQLEKLDCEKETIVNLKNHVMFQLDILLKQGSVDAWCEILVWYQYVIQKDLAHRFWEFYVLKMMLDIFIAECKESSKNGQMPSVLQLHGMKEMQDVYFKTVFLLRRLEFNVEPVSEMEVYARERKLSPSFVNYILKNAQIHNKEKVRNAIEGWY